MHHQPRLSNKKIGTARIKKNLNKIAILFITYKDYTPLLLTHVINVQQILRNIYFFKKSQKNPNGSELQVKTNVCIFYTPMKKPPKQPTDKHWDRTMGMPWSTLLERTASKTYYYRMQWYTLTMHLNTCILVYTDLEVTVYLLSERKKKLQLNYY